MGCGTSKTVVRQFSRQISELSSHSFTHNVHIIKSSDISVGNKDPLNTHYSKPDKMETVSDQQPTQNKTNLTESGTRSTETSVKSNHEKTEERMKMSDGQAEKDQGELSEGQDQPNEGQGDEEQESKAKVPKKLSPEEVEKKYEKKIGEMQDKITNVMSEDVYNEEGIPTYPFRQSMLELGKLYYALKGAPRKDVEKYKQESGQIFCKTDFLEFICKYIIDTLNEKKYKTSEGETVPKFYNSMKNCLTMVLNYSDALISICERLCKMPGFLDCMRSSLEAMKGKHFEREGTDLSDEDRLIKTILGILHNIGMSESCVVYLRNHDFTPILLIYMDSRLAMCRLSSIAALADIVDEKESGLLQARNSGIKFLIKIFEKSLKNELHKELGWSSWELARTVGRLARNDANKKMLVEQGVLPLLVKLSASDDVEEEKVAVESLWVLAFDEDNKEKILEETGLMEMLVEKYQNSSDKHIRKACQGTLWNLRERLKSSEKYSDIGKEFGGTSSSAHQQNKSHIMISYNWANQDLLKHVRDSLKQIGYPVWMDIDNMGGSTLQAMAEAIENASVVLISMSQKYKDSPNCRAEAEYAFSQRKEIIPILVEKGYRPDGWLGIILGAKLFFDFSGKYSYESRFEGLKKEVEQRLGGTERAVSKDVVDAGHKQPVVAVTAPVSYRAPPVSHTDLEHVKQWTPAEVNKWLNKHNLHGQKLEKLTGKEVAFLKNVRYEAPEFFFRTLETKLGLVDLLDLVNFTEAMEDLTN